MNNVDFYLRMLVIILIRRMAIIIVYTIFAVRLYCKIVEENLRKSFLGERFYDTNFFHNRVERILIDDHNVPRLKYRKRSERKNCLLLYLI
jgi:hypothetical protein